MPFLVPIVVPLSAEGLSPRLPGGLGPVAESTSDTRAVFCECERL